MGVTRATAICIACIFLYFVCTTREYAHLSASRTCPWMARRHRQLIWWSARLDPEAHDPCPFCRDLEISASPFRAACPALSYPSNWWRALYWKGRSRRPISHPNSDESTWLLRYYATAVSRARRFPRLCQTSHAMTPVVHVPPSLPWISLYKRATCADKRNFIIRALLISRGNK